MIRLNSFGIKTSKINKDTNSYNYTVRRALMLQNPEDLTEEQRLLRNYALNRNPNCRY